jgi:hypothetical protein
MVPKDILLPLAIFVALLLTASLHGLAASGHFPREHRTPSLSSGLGPTILFGSILVVIVCIAIGIGTTVRLIPWYAAIIGGGLSVLSAPLILQRFADNFVDGRGALIAFSIASVAFALLLIWIATSGTLHP